MPQVSRETASQRVSLDGLDVRVEHLDGGYSVCFEEHTADADLAELFRGLPDDRCQAPHWGYLFSGRMVVDYGDRRETVEAGQAYYIAPGHLIAFETDCEALEFTPTDALEQTMEAVRRNSAAGEAHGG